MIRDIIFSNSTFVIDCLFLHCACYLESEYLVRALSGGGEGDDDEHVGGGNRLSPGPEAAESVAASKVTEHGTGAKGLL